jgi:prophage DNA circulation protein
MKLYSSSGNVFKTVEAKWVIIKYGIGGILLGAIILFGVMKLNQSEANAHESRSASTLEAENNFLRQQVSLISDQMKKMEMQAEQLRERANRLDMLLHGSTMERDTASSFTKAAGGLKPRSSIYAAGSFRP